MHDIRPMAAVRNLPVLSMLILIIGAGSSCTFDAEAVTIYKSDIGAHGEATAHGMQACSMQVLSSHDQANSEWRNFSHRLCCARTGDWCMWNAALQGEQGISSMCGSCSKPLPSQALVAPLPLRVALLLRQA